MDLLHASDECGGVEKYIPIYVPIACKWCVWRSREIHTYLCTYCMQVMCVEEEQNTYLSMYLLHASDVCGGVEKYIPIYVPIACKWCVWKRSEIHTYLCTYCMQVMCVEEEWNTYLSMYLLHASDVCGRGVKYIPIYVHIACNWCVWRRSKIHTYLCTYCMQVMCVEEEWNTYLSCTYCMQVMCVEEEWNTYLSMYLLHASDVCGRGVKYIPIYVPIACKWCVWKRNEIHTYLCTYCMQVMCVEEEWNTYLSWRCISWLFSVSIFLCWCLQH